MSEFAWANTRAGAIILRRDRLAPEHERIWRDEDLGLKSEAWATRRVRFGPNEQTAWAGFASSLVGPSFGV